MIVCTRCGFQNEDSDTFCGSCAGFLEWSGEAVSQAPPPEPVAEPEPTVEPEHAGFIDRVKERIGLGEKEADDGRDAVTAPESASIAGDGGSGDGATAPQGGEPAPAALSAQSGRSAKQPTTRRKERRS